MKIPLIDFTPGGIFVNDRSEMILALILPLFALVWVVADATSGAVSAARLQSAPIAIGRLADVISETQASTRGETAASEDACASDTSRAALGQLHPALQRLCQAGLKLTERLSNG